jgi:hypothetical protein
MMEAWFHADSDALERFYGKDFKKKALKANPEVEKIPKKHLSDGLKAATKTTSKGNYYDHKTSHGAKLLALIDPARVRAAAPNCHRLFETVLTALS